MIVKNTIKKIDQAVEKTKLAIKKFVEKDPTVDIDSLSSAFIWKTIFSRLPSTTILENSALSLPEVDELLRCALLSRVIYKDDKKRFLPGNMANIVFECKESDFYKIPYFVINSEELDTIYIVCRGSYCFKDFLVDFMASTTPYRGGQVHEGIYLCAINLFHSVKPIVRKLSIMHNHRKIIITGHSLGGGVAGMLAEIFNAEEHDLNVSAVCFAPVSSMSQDIWAMSKSFIRTYVLDGDFVPFISYHNAMNLPQDALPKLFRKKLDKAVFKRINRHSVLPEFQDLIVNEPIEQPNPLYPPGNTYLIKMVDEETNEIQLQKISNHIGYFGQFVKELNEFRHSMKIYKSWIIKYFVDFHNRDPKIIDYYDFKKERRSRNLASPSTPALVSYQQDWVDPAPRPRPIGQIKKWRSLSLIPQY